MTASLTRSLSLAGLSAIALAASQPAFAQDATADAAAADSTDAGLDTIIVTANRREENLQDVAVSAATLSAEAIGAVFQAGAEVTSLSGRVPGLFVESSNGRAAPRFYIRGLGNTDFDLAASQPVSVVMDDVVLENVSLKAFPIFDIERVEVLRGPQGTLFGRNTPAGIVKIDTKGPTDELSYDFSASYGSYGSLSIDGGVGGTIVPDVITARISMLAQSRQDWVDNGYTGQDDALGDFSDMAGRLQVEITPTEALSILGSLQFRHLDGTATLFRANILGPGNNELNGNYDRDTVWYDDEGDNEARYDALIGSVKAAYDFGGATLTSITAWADSKGRGRGDIDGGYGASYLPVMGPGLILFQSASGDSIDLKQFTQEVRLASNGTGPMTWQVGAFYFDSDFDVTTVDFTGFSPGATVNHTNESWAVFGQTSYQLTDRAKITAGLRYTDDQKDFFVKSGDNPQPRSVQDDRISWDLAAFLDVTDDASVFTRVASGFRAPTIQGRDVAFFGSPSVATSEKIMSYEAGFKSELAGRTIRLNGAAFYYTIDDPQFSAVGGEGNLVQLVNANKGRGYGFELDTAFQPVPQFTLTAGLSYNNTRIDDANLLVGICPQCTVTDPTVVLPAPTPTDPDATVTRANVNGNPFPNAPKWIGNLTARYGVPISSDAEIFAYTDWTYVADSNFLLYESKEFNIDSQIEGGLRLGYAKLDGSYEIAAFVRNITDADHVKGVVDFNNNTGFVNDPRIFGLSARFSY